MSLWLTTSLKGTARLCPTTQSGSTPTLLTRTRCALSSPRTQTSTPSCTSLRTPWSARACSCRSSTCGTTWSTPATCSRSCSSTGSSASSSPRRRTCSACRTEQQAQSVTEGAPIKPGSPYGESKFFVERVLHWLHRIHSLRYVAPRYFNAPGALPDCGEDHDPETHLIPLVLQVALGHCPHVTIFSDNYPTRDGTCVRDYIHVAELAQAHLLALQAIDQLGARSCNLGNGSGYTRQGSGRDRVAGHRAPDPGCGRSTPPWRPGSAGRLVGAHPPRAGLGAAVSRPGVHVHHPQRAGVAPRAAQRLRMRPDLHQSLVPA